MPVEISKPMIRALKLIKGGKTPQQAADLAGVKRQSIYASSAYKKQCKELAEKASTK